MLFPNDPGPDGVRLPAVIAAAVHGVPVGHAVSAAALQELLDHCHHLYRGVLSVGVVVEFLLFVFLCFQCFAFFFFSVYLLEK